MSGSGIKLGIDGALYGDGDDEDIDIWALNNGTGEKLFYDQSAGYMSSDIGLTLTAGKLRIDDTTDSTSSTTGSLRTAGGLGVVKKAHFGNKVTIENTTPQLRFIDTNASLNEGDWEFVTLGDASFNLRTLTEAGGAGETAMSVTRTGTAIDTIEFTKGLNVGVAPSPPIADVLYQEGIVQAWCVFDSAALPTEIDSFNVASYVDRNPGSTEVHFDTAIANATYASFATGHDRGSATTPSMGHIRLQTATKLEVNTHRQSTGAETDSRVSVLVLGGR